MLPPDDSDRKRIFEALAAAVDAELDDDRRWFAANPKRAYRARRTFPSEQLRELTVSDSTCLPGQRCYTLVKQVVPGARIRRIFTAPRNYLLPVTEAGTRRLWLQLLGDDEPYADMLAKIEAWMQEAA